MTGSMQDGNPTEQTAKLGAKCLLRGNAVTPIVLIFAIQVL